MMHAVIKKIIQSMQQGSSGVFTLHDGNELIFKQITSIGGDDNLIDFLDAEGVQQQTQLSLLVDIKTE